MKLHLPILFPVWWARICMILLRLRKSLILCLCTACKVEGEICRVEEVRYTQLRNCCGLWDPRWFKEQGSPVVNEVRSYYRSALGCLMLAGSITMLEFALTLFTRSWQGPKCFSHYLLPPRAHINRNLDCQWKQLIRDSLIGDEGIPRSLNCCHTGPTLSWS